MDNQKSNFFIIKLKKWGKDSWVVNPKMSSQTISTIIDNSKNCAKTVNGDWIPALKVRVKPTMGEAI